MAAELPETLEAKQAHQRSSLKWILSKAFNNQVPDNLRDPFYRDHDEVEHIKPQIVVGLGNASLYCQALSNLYSDPNYQSLNHWSILQTMARKGIPMPETPDVQLTETALIQTNPLRINSHMLVIDALMVLYAKEVATADRVANAIGRISGGQLQRDKFNFESGLLMWISHACAALKRRINAELEADVDGSQFHRLQSPNIPPIREFRDLCDGVCLAFLVSFYCPRIVPWTNVRVNHLPTVEDSIHNILLLSNFSEKHLPYTVFHMTPSDITYNMRGAMTRNLVALLADLFNLFEIHPTKCVNYPGMEQQIAVNRSSSASSMRRVVPPQSAMQPHQQQPTLQPAYSDFHDPGSDEGFVVHRSRAIPTLTSAMHHHEPLQPARLRQTKEKTNMDSKADERGDHTQTAGRPSNWEDQRRPSYAGRRSRRNSFTEDSQLTIENFGGSQDQINMIGRTVELERKYSNSTLSHVTEPAVALRSSVADARGTLQLGYNESPVGAYGNNGDLEKQDRDTEKRSSLRRQGSVDNVSLGQLKQHSQDDASGEPAEPMPPTPRKKTSFSALPATTTTWQQQHLNYQNADNNHDDYEPLEDMSKMTDIRMKLEEKRRHIELEKRRMEIQLSKQQQKVGKAAFLQAINKDPNAVHDQTDPKKTPESESSDLEHYQRNIPTDHHTPMAVSPNIHHHPPQRFGGSTPHLSPALASHHPHHQQQQSPVPVSSTTAHSYNIHDQYSMHHQASPPPQALRNQHYASSPSQYSSQHDIHSMHQQSQHHYVGQNQPQYMSAVHSESNQYQTYRVESTTSHHQPSAAAGAHHHRSGHDEPPASQFFLHDNAVQQPSYHHPQPQHYSVEPQPQPVPTRRTWAQQSAANNGTPPPSSNAPPPLDINAWSQNSPKPDHRATWKSSSPYTGDSGASQPSAGGFMLHQQQHQNGNAAHHIDFHQSSPQVNRGSDLHRSYSNLSPAAAESPQHQRVHRQISQIIAAAPPVSPSVNAASAYPVHTNGHRGGQSLQQQQALSPNNIDDMAPQSISFIGDVDNDDDDEVDEAPRVQKPTVPQRRSHYMEVPAAVTSSELQEHELDLGRLNITSGKLTYRIPSPTRPSLNLNSFDDPNEEPITSAADQKGFYIAFDNAQPKRPKPPLRAKRSPKKERNAIDQPDEKPSSTTGSGSSSDNNNAAPSNRTQQLHSQYDEQFLPPSVRHDNEPAVQRRSVSSNHMMAEHGIDLQQRHLEDLTNRRLHSQMQPQTHVIHQQDNAGRSKENKLIVDDTLVNVDPDTVDEMERKKEKIMLLSLQRRQQQEEAKARKEVEAMQRREREQNKQDERERKREQQMARRAAILEQHKFKKAIEEAEQKGLTIDRNDLMMMKQQLAMSNAALGGTGGAHGGASGPSSSSAATKMRPNRVVRPRPKTIHVESGSVDMAGHHDGPSVGGGGLAAARNKKGSNSNLTGVGGQLSSNSMRRDYYRGSQDSLAIREPTVERGRTISRISVAKGSNLNFRGRKSNSLMNLCADTDSGLGRATPPRRAPSPGMGPSGRHLPSPSGPGSLPPGFMNKRRIYDDGSSDISSAASSIMDYSGPKLYKQPATKSNRSIILNAVEYCVFPGVVNRDAKMKVLDKIARSEAKHFLVLFRDAGCQFRALYGYWPENESVHKLYGTGPNIVDEFMFDKFFKYNSGGKCFSPVHTKHLTVTIDAFTIHNSLWQGKKVAMPSKRDMTLVI